MLGRRKLKLAPPLHNKVLYPNADMHTADWMTSLAPTVGVAGLIDARLTSGDSKDPHPLPGEIDSYLRSLDWVHTAGARVHDEGQVFHIESFLVPKPLEAATPERLEATRARLLDLDWKVRDAVIVPRHRSAGRARNLQQFITTLIWSPAPHNIPRGCRPRSV